MAESLSERVSLSAAIASSRYAGRLLQAHPEYEEELAAAGRTPWTGEEMSAFIADAADLPVRLRQLRQRVLLRTAARDLGGLAPLNEVMQTMSDLAEVALQAAHRLHRAQLIAEYGEPMAGDRVQDLLVVGMGKLGGRELNVSSDIDLIFVYPAEGETAGTGSKNGKLSNQEFFTRLGQRLVRTLNDTTTEGFVFRVDMRLRPWGDSGALATGFDALEQYFVAHGREWERYAWIKARVVAGGDAESCAALQQIVQPFVFRKYLDYGSIAAVRSLHAQIRQEVSRRDLGDHIKLGPGGIREIEFIAQSFQLIRGGRDTPLRERATLKILATLGAKHLLDEAQVRELTEAYVFLRRLEHRLQYLDDAQTHRLPVRAEDRALIATSMGCSDWPALQETIDAHRGAVTRQFETVFADHAPEENDLGMVWIAEADDPTAAAQLGALGYAEPGQALQRLYQFRRSYRYETSSASSQARVDRLMPALIAAAARTTIPDATLNRAIDFIEAISRRAAYLALLHDSPQALGRVAEILGASAWAATYLQRHPAVLDELLDLRQLHQPPDWSEFALTLRREMSAHAGDTERQMDLMRELHHAQIFRLLAQDVAGILSVERLADHLSLAADLILNVSLEECWKLVRNRHCETPRVAVIGYGRLGGKELGYASDVDLVFVYDDPHEAAQENYARLVQRMTTWLSSSTAAGMLFDADLRLRPNGEAGLLANSLASFRRYQRESAWSWEHQALTRARFVAGDSATGALFEDLRRDILTSERDVPKLREEVLAMRQKMFDGHPNRSALFDIKHDRGGMVDIEFIVQYVVLAHAREHYQLTANLGNITLLHIAGALRFVPNSLAAPVADAYRVYRRLQHKLRLNGAPYARVERAEVAQEIDATLALWDAVFG
jgi:[glutamine synthetase] adenylyltransferase / [glutamine synthetase]-adenylyl-L-tyrosine phosphorylase